MWVHRQKYENFPGEPALGSTVEVNIMEDWVGEGREKFIQQWYDEGFCKEMIVIDSLSEYDITIYAKDYFDEASLDRLEESLDEASDMEIEFTINDIETLIAKEHL